MSEIVIKKYYLDCVDAHGRAFIGYSARLAWRAFELHYQSCLLSAGAPPLDTRASIARHSFPSITEDAIEWDAPQLGLHGTWRSCARGVRRMLSSTPDCEIHWDCLQPRSDCVIEVQEHETLRGQGYAECLEVRLTRWRLPFSELKWGRFISEDLALIWIDWMGGAQEQHLLFWNGDVLEGCTIGDDRLLIPARNARLALTRRSVLKESSIVPPALGKIPGFSSLLPRSLTQSREAKWLSTGILTQADAPDRVGWAIHERVVFR